MVLIANKPTFRRSEYVVIYCQLEKSQKYSKKFKTFGRLNDHLKPSEGFNVDFTTNHNYHLFQPSEGWYSITPVRKHLAKFTVLC